MAKLDSLIVDLQANTAGLRKGLDDAKGMFDSFGKKLGGLAEGAIVLEGIKLGMEAIAKAGEFMEQGIKDATALGNGPARELGETLEHVGLATRQLGADLMSDLAPAFNALIEYFVGGVDWGKLLADIAGVLGIAFRALVAPLVALAGAMKGLIEGGTLESTLNGAGEAVKRLAEHGKDFAGSLKTAAEMAATIAHMQTINTGILVGREANQLRSNFENLTGERRQDRFAGATVGFSSFGSALHKWEENLLEAADLTEKAAVAEALGQKIQAEAYRLDAAQASAAAEHAKQAAEAFRFAKEKLLRDTQAINNIKFGLGETVNKNALSASIRTQQYNGTYDPTAGFKNFGDALDKETKALDNQAGLQAAAAIIEQQYGAAAQGTVLALKAQADAEGRNAEAAKAAADAFFAVKDRLRDQLMNALKAIGGSFLSNIGSLGKTISDVIQGAQQGGIWGALAAAIMDLLSQIDGWKSIQNIANGQMKELLQTMSSGLGSIISGLKPLMGALGFLSNIVGTLLNPIFELIGQVLQGIAPLFVILGEVLKPLGGTFKQISDIIGAVLKPVLVALTYVFIGIGEVMLALQLAVDYVILGFNKFVDWVDHIGGGNNQGGVDAAQASIDATIAQMKLLASQTPDQLAAIAQASADASEAIGAQTDQTNKATAAMARFTDQLTNAPTGFRYALAQYGATSPQALLGGRIQGGDIHVHASGGVVTTIAQIVKMIDDAQRVKYFRKSGSGSFP